MFIDLMRKNQRALMIVFSSLVILSFVGYYSTRGTTARYGGPSGGAPVAQIYGRTLARVDLDRLQRLYRGAYELGLPNMTRQEVAGDRQLDLFNFYVVQHEAERLGLVPSGPEVEEAIKKVPFFQAEGGKGFDPQKYAGFVANGRVGLNARELEELVRTDWQVGRLHQLTDATVVLPPAQLRAEYEISQAKVVGSLVRLRTADFAAGVAVSEDEIKKAYEEEKDRLVQPERRRVSYVVFQLSPEQKKLPSRERVEAIQKLANQTDEFTQKMSEANADFARVAASYQLPVKTTPEFEQENAAAQLRDQQLPPDIVDTLATVAFQLNPQEPTSEPQENNDNDAFYVLHLDHREPSRPLSLEEARPKVVQSLRDRRARDVLTKKAAEIRPQLLKELGEGKTLADAAKAAGQTAQDFPPFSQADRDQSREPRFPDSELVLPKAAQLPARTLSDFLPTPDGGLFVFVKERQPVDEARLARELPFFTPQVTRFRQQAAFYEWLRTGRSAARFSLVEPTRGG